MPQEIERKFLVRSDAYKSGAKTEKFKQGYLAADIERTVRVRVAGKTAFVTIKGKAVGISRAEYEYKIPVKEAEEILDNLCLKPVIEKTRYFIKYRGHTWEVDEFSGENAGLVVAEIELTSEDEPFEKPVWIGEEVTGDHRYSNSSLVKTPYSKWPPR